MRNEDADEQAIRDFVITSYSIHYTKLYDLHSALQFKPLDQVVDAQISQIDQRGTEFIPLLSLQFAGVFQLTGGNELMSQQQLAQAQP